jgi:hypothetical protein
MTLADFVRLGLCSPLPVRSQPEVVRLALEQTSRLPVELVTWVATAPAQVLKVQYSQAVMVRFGTKDRTEAAQAGQLALLIKRRLLQLGFTYHRGGFYDFGPKPAAQPVQLRLF